MIDTYVHSAYKKPAKQKAAISIRRTNCMIIALKERTICSNSQMTVKKYIYTMRTRLFLSVTNASLKYVSLLSWEWCHWLAHLGNTRQAASARQSMPLDRAQRSRNFHVSDGFRVKKVIHTIVPNTIYSKRGVASKDCDYLENEAYPCIVE